MKVLAVFVFALAVGSIRATDQPNCVAILLTDDILLVFRSLFDAAETLFNGLLSGTVLQAVQAIPACIVAGYLNDLADDLRKFPDETSKFLEYGKKVLICAQNILNYLLGTLGLLQNYLATPLLAGVEVIKSAIDIIERYSKENADKIAEMLENLSVDIQKQYKCFVTDPE